MAAPEEQTKSTRPYRRGCDSTCSGQCFGTEGMRILVVDARKQGS